MHATAQFDPRATPQCEGCACAAPLPGLRDECRCAELAAAFKLPPPEPGQCPALEDRREARLHTSAESHARTARALSDLTRAERDAERAYARLAARERRFDDRLAAVRAELRRRSRGS